MGVDDNTIVVFTTDNGAENSLGLMADRRRSPAAAAPPRKADSVVLALLRWPGKVLAGKVENGIFSGMD